MSRVLVICSALCVCVSVVYARNFGTGLWDMLAINKCEESSHKFKFDLTLMKINETHDGFKGRVVLNEDFDDAFGIRLEICKIVDGDCRQYHTVSDECMIDFFYKYANDSVTACLKAAGADEMPIKKGEYDIESYVFTDEPAYGMYGNFSIKAFVLQGEEDVGCLETRMLFKKIEEEEK